MREGSLDAPTRHPIAWQDADFADREKTELVATVMFEIDDPVRRAAKLARLGGVEDCAFIELDGQRLRGKPAPTRENTSPEGKASAVQFLKFRFPRETIARFKTPGRQIVIGFDHPNYTHMAVLAEPMRAKLAKDFAEPGRAATA